MIKSTDADSPTAVFLSSIQQLTEQNRQLERDRLEQSKNASTWHMRFNDQCEISIERGQTIDRWRYLLDRAQEEIRSLMPEHKDDCVCGVCELVTNIQTQLRQVQRRDRTR